MKCSPEDPFGCYLLVQESSPAIWPAEHSKHRICFESNKMRVCLTTAFSWHMCLPPRKPAKAWEHLLKCWGWVHKVLVDWSSLCSSKKCSRFIFLMHVGRYTCEGSIHREVQNVILDVMKWVMSLQTLDLLAIMFNKLGRSRLAGVAFILNSPV